MLMLYPATPLRLPWTSMGPLPMPSGLYWTPDVVGVGFRIWEGRGVLARLLPFPLSGA
jgi:hypothetical protein